jgi:hypothetical protein
MFGLPTATVLLLIGPPLVWIIYTFVFLRITRHWNDQSDTDGES